MALGIFLFTLAIMSATAQDACIDESERNDGHPVDDYLCVDWIDGSRLCCSYFEHSEYGFDDDTMECTCVGPPLKERPVHVVEDEPIVDAPVEDVILSGQDLLDKNDTPDTAVTDDDEVKDQTEIDGEDFCLRGDACEHFRLRNTRASVFTSGDFCCDGSVYNGITIHNDICTCRNDTAAILIDLIVDDQDPTEPVGDNENQVSEYGTCFRDSTCDLLRIYGQTILISGDFCCPGIRYSGIQVEANVCRCILEETI